MFLCKINIYIFLKLAEDDDNKPKIDALKYMGNLMDKDLKIL